VYPVQNLSGGNIPSVAPTGEHLRIDVRSESDRVVLALHGELDLLGAPQLQKEIESAAVDAKAILVLDLEDLEFVDSAGLRVILAARERSQRHGHQFAVTRGPEQVRRLFAIAGVSEHLRTLVSPDELLV
jgi:anti-sigma B factor antagonist